MTIMNVRCPKRYKWHRLPERKAHTVVAGRLLIGRIDRLRMPLAPGNRHAWQTPLNPAGLWPEDILVDLDIESGAQPVFDHPARKLRWLQHGLAGRKEYHMLIPQVLLR
jgi:hypothetical protein